MIFTNTDNAENPTYTYKMVSNNGLSGEGGYDFVDFSVTLKSASDPLNINLNPSDKYNITFNHYPQVLIEGFQPSGIDGESVSIPFNFSDLGSNAIDGSNTGFLKTGKTLLYFDYPTSSDASYQTTGSISSSILNDPSNYIINTVSGITQLTAYNYDSDITSSGEADDFNIFNFHIKVNFSGSVAYNAVNLIEGYNFRFGIAKETTPLFYSNNINIPLIESPNYLESSSFETYAVYQYSTTASNITSFNPLENLSFFIEDVNNIGVGEIREDVGVTYYFFFFRPIF
jgi:hypothetical protein